MKTNRLKASQSKKLEAYLFILPAFFYVLLVMGYPLLYNAVLSLQNMDVKNLKKGTAVFIGLKNYVELFHDIPSARAAVCLQLSGLPFRR